MRHLNRAESQKALPTLSSQLKGTTVKLLACFVADILPPSVSGDVYAEHRATAAWAMAQFIYLCDTNGLTLADETLSEVLSCGELFIQAFAWLYRFCWGRPLFRLRPKIHYFEHLLDQTRRLRLNPAKIGTWGDESFLKYVKRTSKNCHGKTVLHSSLQKYLSSLHERWSRRHMTFRRVLRPRARKKSHHAALSLTQTDL